MKQRLVILLLLFGFNATVFAQDLTGTWRGLFNDFKLVLIQKGDSLFGYSYDTGMGFCEAHFLGSFQQEKKLIKGENTGFIRRTASHGLSSYSLMYSADAGGEYLKGSIGAKGTALKILSFGMRERVAYKKVSNRVDTTTFMAKRLSGKPEESAPEETKPALAEMENQPIIALTTDVLTVEKEKRKTTLFKRIETSVDSITLRLYDNGTIDNDTVTVFYNGKIILERLGLTATIYEIRIAVNESFYTQRIELMANNLGSIPPNTANLEIKAGKSTYTLRVAADYTVNAGIDVLYKKQE